MSWKAFGDQFESFWFLNLLDETIIQMTIDELELLLDWNRDDERSQYRPPQEGETVATFFEQLTSKFPGHCALVTESGLELSYHTVNEKANSIARCIALHANRDANGILAPSCVLVALPRSTALPVALLGVVKSGLAYWGVDILLQSVPVVMKNMSALNCRTVITDEVVGRMLFPDSLPSNVTCITLLSNGDVSAYKGSGLHSSSQSHFQCPPEPCM